MNRVLINERNKALQRIESRCISCGQCLRTCQENNGLCEGDCIHCGACILACPMGALVPKYQYKEVLANLQDEEKIVVVSMSPAVRVAIGDEFGYEAGAFLEEKCVGVLRALGFSYVFDTSFGADLTVMEEASEFLKRLETGKLPLFTSCCPSWVSYMKKYHSEDLTCLSSCKSPIGMQGAIIKSYFAKQKNLNPEDIVTVSLTPCISKKEEIYNDPYNDYVITTSELAMMIRESKIDFKNIEESSFDSLLGNASRAGLQFGASGGVTSAVLNTAYYFLHGENPKEDFISFQPSVSNAFKEAIVDFGNKKIKVAMVYGMSNIDYPKLKEYALVEVMTCPNGCVGGGGQPILPLPKLKEVIIKRKESLQKTLHSSIFYSHQNPEIQNVYKEFLEQPLSSKAKEYLHCSQILEKAKNFVDE